MKQQSLESGAYTQFNEITALQYRWLLGAQISLILSEEWGMKYMILLEMVTVQS